MIFIPARLPRWPDTSGLNKRCVPRSRSACHMAKTGRFPHLPRKHLACLSLAIHLNPYQNGNHAYRPGSSGYLWLSSCLYLLEARA